MKLLPSLLAALSACAPALPEFVPGPADVDVRFDFEADSTTRVAAFQVSIEDGFGFVGESYSEPDHFTHAMQIPDQPEEAFAGMGELGAITGDAVHMVLMAYKDADDSETWDEGESILGWSYHHPIQVRTGNWYTLDFAPFEPVPVLGFIDDDSIDIADFTAPIGFPVGGGSDATMPPTAELPLPPANRVATMNAAEPAYWQAQAEAGAQPQPLPGRPVDVPFIGDGAFMAEFAADPGPYFHAAGLFEVEGLGFVALEAPIAYIDDGDDLFTVDFTPTQPSFDEFGRPDRDIIVGQICYAGSQVVAMYRPTPRTLGGALVTWGGFGGNTGWSLVYGLDAEIPYPQPVPTDAYGALTFHSGDCAE